MANFEDDPIYGSSSEPQSVYHHLTKKDVTSFFTALSTNNTFDCGERSKEEDMMYCPCSKSIKNWTYIFSLGHIISDEKKSPVPFCASNKFNNIIFFYYYFLQYVEYLFFMLFKKCIFFRPPWTKPLLSVHCTHEMTPMPSLLEYI